MSQSSAVKSGGLAMLAVLLAAAVNSALAAVPTSSPAGAPDLPKRIAEAVEQLADRDFATREKAQQFLWSVGRQAEPALKAALNRDDPEITSRAKEVLAKVKWGILPDTPQAVVDLIGRYRAAADENEKQRLMYEFTRAGKDGAKALLALSRAEEDERLRKMIGETLIRSGVSPASSLLAEGDLAGAEEWLAIQSPATGGAAFTSFGRTPPQVSEYLRHLVLRGETDRALIRLGAAAAADPISAWLPAHVYRAAGDLDKAQALADKCNDKPLLAWLAVERGDWKKVVEGYGADKSGEWSGFRAACYRLAGDKDNADKALVELRAGPARAMVPSVREQLLLNECVAEVVETVSKDDPLTAFALLSHQRRLAEALKLAEAGVDKSDTRRYGPMAANRVRLLLELGEKEQAADFVEQTVADEKGGAAPALSASAAVEFLTSAGRSDRARELCIEALAKPGLSSQQQALTVAAMYPTLDRTRARMVWVSLRDKSPDEAMEKAVDRLGKAMAEPMTREQFAALAGETLAIAAKAGKREEVGQLRVIETAAEDAGHTELAAEYRVKLAEAEPQSYEWLRAGQLHGEAGHWDQAAECFARAEKLGQQAVEVKCNRALAEIKLGHQEEGEKLMLAALLMPPSFYLGEPVSINAVRELRRWRMDAWAERCDRALLHIGDPLVWGTSEYLTTLAEQAAAKGDYAAAANLCERLRLARLRPGRGMGWLHDALTWGALAHGYRAREHLVAGRTAQAMDQMEQLWRLMPGEDEALPEVVRLADKLGHKKEADAIFARALEFYTKLRQQYPKGLRIQYWTVLLEAQCGRRLDEALADGRRLHEARPSDPEYMEPLAEALLARGEYPEALALARKCVELRPLSQWHRDRLKRYEAAAAAGRAPAPPAP